MCFGGGASRQAATARGSVARRQTASSSIGTKFTPGIATGKRTDLGNGRSFMTQPGLKAGQMHRGLEIKHEVDSISDSVVDRFYTQASQKVNNAEELKAFRSKYGYDSKHYGDKAFYKTGKIDNPLGRTPVADEAGTRIKTKRVRQAAVEAKNTEAAPRKSKKRGGLRVDRSSGTNSVSSGVFIPK